MWGISDADMLDKRKVKIIDGIAGAAKSSGIDKFFREHGIVYARFTSTNKLSRDAEERYGGYCDTIAGGMFETVNGIFYSEEKKVNFGAVVIDEILQASPKVYDWIKSNVGDVNIVVTADSQQTLNPQIGMRMLEMFNALKEEPYAISVELTKSYRPRNEKTAAYFQKCYYSAKDGVSLYYQDRKKFRVIPFASLCWSDDDVYICHTNEHEKYLYNEFDLFHRYDGKLIPKGGISKKTDGLDSYPILPQALVGNNANYCQLANVGTPTRYQGSEVKQGNKLYYLVSPRSGVTAREWYTVVTRCWDIDSIVIVLCDLPMNTPLKEYGGAVVKPSGFASISGGADIGDGVKLADLVKDKKRVELPPDVFQGMMDGVKDTDERHYLTTGFFCDGVYVTSENKGFGKGEAGSGKTYAGVSIQSLLKKDAVFSASYLPAFYRSFERVQKLRWGGAPVEYYHARGAYVCCHGREKDVPFFDDGDLQYQNIIPRQKYRYEIDLYSAYPHILAKAKLPTGIRFQPRPEGMEDQPYNSSVDTGKVDWYLCGSSDIVSEGSVITGELARMIQREGKGGQLCYYIGTSDFQIGSMAGDWLLKKAFHTVEAKAQIKEMHYGWLEKSYLEPVEYRDGEVSVYASHDYYAHELLMCAIKSELCLCILKLKQAIYGRFDRGYSLVDALFFDCDLPVEEIGRLAEKAIPGYAFRLKENYGEHRVVWKNYPDLETEKERKARLRRERRERKKNAE